MTYDTAYLAADFFGFIKHLQARIDHEAHALKVARLLEIRVRLGAMNRSNPEGLHGAQIMVQPWWYGNSDVLRHELAHIMLWWSGLEAEIIAEFGDELGWKVIENLCNHAVAFLRYPQPLVDDAIKEHGVSAQAVQHLRSLVRGRPEQALNRLIYDDPHALRAGFLTNGLFIQEVAQCNWSLPFSWLAEIRNPVRCFPEDAKVTFAWSNSNSLIGVCVG